jgi:hypothetical protein
VTLTRSILDGSPLSSPLAPHVQPPYYAAIIAAEAIGNTGSTKAVELYVNNPQLAGYAFYEDGSLVRAIFINSQAYLSGDTSRGSMHIDLKLSGSGFSPLHMSVKRLAIGYAFLHDLLVVLCLTCAILVDTRTTRRVSLGAAKATKLVMAEPAGLNPLPGALSAMAWTLKILKSFFSSLSLPTRRLLIDAVV